MLGEPGYGLSGLNRRIFDRLGHAADSGLQPFPALLHLFGEGGKGGRDAGRDFLAFLDAVLDFVDQELPGLPNLADRGIDEAAHAFLRSRDGRLHAGFELIPLLGQLIPGIADKV
ncbi:hypothetical protein D1872_281270 [compost metagenome]